MARASVLLVEDDPAVVRFFELAVDDLGIELRTCTGVAAALDALREQAVHLIITDLMLPGEPGTVLLRRLWQGPESALRCGARLVVCSAGISATMQAELDDLGVWRQLHKPVTVGALRACILEGVSFEESANLGGARIAATGSANTAPDEAAAIAHFFAGDAALFKAYREACLRQFPLDLGSGNAAFEEHDVPALCRLAHSLKSVLLSLGMQDASACAKRLELAAYNADWGGVVKEWSGVQVVLAELSTPRQRQV